MNKKLLRSVVALVATLAIGGGTTYALFTSNTVNLTSNSMTTGTAEIKICDTVAPGTNVWDTSLTGYSIADLVPGAAAEEMTPGSDKLFIGNDDSTLNTELTGPARCTSGSNGSSDVDVNIIPVVTLNSCADPLDDELSLTIKVGTGSLTKTLFQWTTNTTVVGDTVTIGGTQQVQMFASLDVDSETTSTACTFNVAFTGEQDV